jgi:hypothetical protein
LRATSVSACAAASARRSSSSCSHIPVLALALPGGGSSLSSRLALELAGVRGAEAPAR